MGDFIYFTDEQKERANAVPIADILRKEHEEVVRSGREWRWKRHHSVTFHGSSWYRHSQEVGGHAIDFMQEFFNMTFPEAVTYLLDGETGQVIRGKQDSTSEQGRNERKTSGQGTSVEKTRKEKSVKEKSVKEKSVKEKSGQQALAKEKTSNRKTSGDEGAEEKKELVPPERNATMKRVYAYLLQKRYISREILSYFVDQKTIYEEKKHHNIVFAGLDKEGNIRHIHSRGTYSEGECFRINEEGSDPSYGFGHAGTGNKLYVFEAPIDFLSFLTLYPKNWQENSYIVLNGVAEHAMLQMLIDHPNLDTIILCLDYDAAGIEGSGRLAEILRKNGHTNIRRLLPRFKDWNEDLKELNGEQPIPAEEHPKLIECAAWINVLKEVADSIQIKNANKQSICRYYLEMYQELKKGNTKEHLEEAFDGHGMLLAGVLVCCMEKEGRELGKVTGTSEILDNLCRRYQPHRDKGNLKTHLRNMQEAFEETMEILDTKDLSVKENKILLVKKYMSLTMECIKAHIFVKTEYKEPRMTKQNKSEEVKENNVQEQAAEEAANREAVMICSQL